MDVISVRLDNDTEARLKREAKEQGVSFSAFLRKRLTDEQQEVLQANQKESAETLEPILRQIADFLCRMEQEQKESGCLTQQMIFNSMWLLMPQNRENVKKLWSVSLQKVREHMAEQEGKSS